MKTVGRYPDVVSSVTDGNQSKLGSDTVLGLFFFLKLCWIFDVGHSLVAVCGLLTGVASLVSHEQAGAHGLSTCGAQV